jgi:hypothetical protein
MSKNVVVNGETYKDVSTIQLSRTDGATALFKDIDEISSVAGIAEIASGTFSVQVETSGNLGTHAETAVVINHGMTTMPDVYIIVPKFWYDTQDNNFVQAICDRRTNHASSIGRRSVESDTWQKTSGPADGYINDIYFYAMGNAFGNFKPTYIDNEGNEKQQEYVWIALKLTE